MLTKMYYHVAADVHAAVLRGAFDLAGPPMAYLLRRSAAPGALDRMDLNPEAWRSASTRIEAEDASARIAGTLAAHECLALVTTARDPGPDGMRCDRAVVLIQVLSGTRRLAGLNPVAQEPAGATLIVTAPEEDPWWATAPPAQSHGGRGRPPNGSRPSGVNLKTCH